MKAVDKCLHNLCTKLLMGVVSLSIFRGNFVLAKVRLGLISVHCLELRGICFSDGSMVKSIGANDLSTVQELSAFQRVHY